MGTRNHKGFMGYKTKSLSNIFPAVPLLYIVVEIPQLKVSQQGEVYAEGFFMPGVNFLSRSCVESWANLSRFLVYVG